MELKGRTVNMGEVEGEAIVLENAFNFTGDFDPKTGTVGIKGHPLFGKRIGGKILVIPTAKGAAGAAISIYNANKAGNAPIGILCQKADPITVESAMIIGIPVMDSFEKEITGVIKTGDRLKICGEKETVEIID
jgi:predicted aconitase with swiveling domain